MPCAGWHEDGDQVEDDVSISDAGRITTARPAAEVAQVRADARQWGTAGAVDYGPGEESGSIETSSALVSEPRTNWWLGRPGRLHWTLVSITSADALLPGTRPCSVSS